MKRLMKLWTKPIAQCLAAAAFAGTLLGGGAAHATGFYVARFGSEHANPTSTDLTSIYYNPAGLAWVKGTRVYIEGDYALRSLTYDRPASAIDRQNPSADYIAAETGEGKLLNLLISPFLGVATDFGVDNLGVGIAFLTPFGGQAIFKKNDAFAGNSQ